MSDTAHPGLQGSVTIMEFADAEDPQVAVLETAAGDLILDKPGDRRHCAHVFGRLRSVALDPDASRATIGAILEGEYR